MARIGRHPLLRFPLTGGLLFVVVGLVYCLLLSTHSGTHHIYTTTHDVVLLLFSSPQRPAPDIGLCGGIVG
jgi:hypothetical protein